MAWMLSAKRTVRGMPTAVWRGPAYPEQGFVQLNAALGLVDDFYNGGVGAMRRLLSGILVFGEEDYRWGELESANATVRPERVLCRVVAHHGDKYCPHARS